MRRGKALLRRAKVRTARLHDARHTAVTMLLVLKVPLLAVMQIMGWSDASVAKRYMHVPNEFVAAHRGAGGRADMGRPERRGRGGGRRSAGLARTCLRGGN